MAYTVLTDSSRAKDQQFPASIVKIELKDKDGNSSLYFEVSKLKDASLTFPGKFDIDNRGTKQQNGFEILFTSNVLASGSDLHTLASEIGANAHDSLLTDVNGHTYTLSAEQFQLVCGEVLEGNWENMKYMTLDGAGSLTNAEYAAMFATS